MGLATASVGLGAILMAAAKPSAPSCCFRRVSPTWITSRSNSGVVTSGSRGSVIALALLGDRDAALVQLGRTFTAGYAFGFWQSFFGDAPAIADLRADVRFKKVLADVRAHAAAEHEQLLKMRAEGLVPDRRTQH